MRLKNSVLAGLLILMTACGGNMQSATAKTPERVKSELKTQGLEVFSVKKSPVKGLYEVVFDGNEIYYVDENAAYLIEGSLIDLKNKKNLTADRVSDFN